MHPHSRSEEALLALAREGDRDAVAELLRRYESTIFGFARSMCRQPQDAEGVLQDTMIAMAGSVADFRGASSTSTWLYTIARNFCIKRRRKGKYTPDRIDSIDELGAPPASSDRSPEEQAAGHQMADSLRAAIVSLQPKYREILVLRDVEELTAPEVAEITGLTVAGVKSRLHRARKMVRDALAERIDAPVSTRRPYCPDVHLMFSQHLEGDLAPDVCRTMEQHLDSCTSCTAACDSLRHTLALCGELRSVVVPDQVRDAVRDEVRAFLANR